MHFLYIKNNGGIIVPIRQGEPDIRTLNKKIDCGIGSGVKWGNVELFFAPDEEFPDDFMRTAPLGKYYIDSNEVKEVSDWQEPEEKNGYNK